MNVSHTTLTQQVAALITEHDCLERKIILKKNTPKRCHAILSHIKTMTYSVKVIRGQRD